MGLYRAQLILSLEVETRSYEGRVAYAQGFDPAWGAGVRPAFALTLAIHRRRLRLTLTGPDPDAPVLQLHSGLARSLPTAFPLPSREMWAGAIAVADGERHVVVAALNLAENTLSLKVDREEERGFLKSPLEPGQTDVQLYVGSTGLPSPPFGRPRPGRRRGCWRLRRGLLYGGLREWAAGVGRVKLGAAGGGHAEPGGGPRLPRPLRPTHPALRPPRGLRLRLPQARLRLHRPGHGGALL